MVSFQTIDKNQDKKLNMVKKQIKNLAKSFRGSNPAFKPFQPASIAPGALPAGMAMDEALNKDFYSEAQKFYKDAPKALNLDGFIGYHKLALLQQDGIIQAMVGSIVEEMFRRWIELVGDAEEKDLVKNALDKFEVKEKFMWAMETCGYQGGALLFIDLGDITPDELKTPLNIDPIKITKGSFKGFKEIEPYTVAPYGYQTVNPLLDNYFQPEGWYINGKKVHSSRFLKFQWNTAPLLLRPAYNFFGIPLPQVVLPYLEDFTTARKAAAKLIDNFSLLGLKTDLSSLLMPNMGEDEEGNPSAIDDLLDRAAVFLGVKNNDGLLLMDKNEEEPFQINTPLSGVEGLVDLSLELIALVPQIPVTKFFGTPPRGFNATGENDETNWLKRVESLLVRHLHKNFEKARKITELSQFGEVKKEIKTIWLPLHEDDEHQKAQTRHVNAQTESIYIDRGVLLPDEARASLASQQDGAYQDLDLDRPLPEIDMAETLPQAGFNPFMQDQVPNEKNESKGLLQRVIASLGGSNG